MNDLPMGWIRICLGDVCEIARGGSPRPIQDYLTDDPEGINWIKISDATESEKYIFKTKQKITRDGISRSRVVKDGDFILSNSMSFGRPYIVRTEGCIHDGWLVLSISNEVFDQDYLYYFLLSEAAYSQFDRKAAGSTVRNLNIDIVKTVEILIPPLNEQGRIVEKLDRLFARSRGAREELGRVAGLCDRYKQAVLAAACAGKLTEDLRHGDIVNSIKLSAALLDLKTGPFGSTLHKSDYVINGLPVINPMHINNGKIMPSSSMTISSAKARTMQDFLMQTGDVVLARRGIVGRCAVVEKIHHGWLCGTGSMILRPNQNLLIPSYLQIFLSSPKIIQALSADAVGSTMINLNQRAILSLPIFLPSLEEQKEIVQRVEKLFKSIEMIEQEAQKALALVDRLEQATLAKAFRGELVPQDPNDEPAATLLERIRAEKQTQPKSKAAKSTRKPKAKS